MSGAAIFLQQFYAYISTFDGNKKDFWDPDIQYRFNCIIHPSCREIDAIKLAHAHLFALGSKVISFNFHRMSADLFFVKFRLVNWKTDVTIQQLVTTQDGRIVQVSPTVKAYLLRADDDELSTSNSRTREQERCLVCRHKSEGKIRSSKIHHFRTWCHQD
ncbi:hypothetical protein ACHAXM_008992 [Skeletonema potamos]|jgi:hypothetical protein